MRFPIPAKLNTTTEDGSMKKQPWEHRALTSISTTGTAKTCIRFGTWGVGLGAGLRAGCRFAGAFLRGVLRVSAVLTTSTDGSYREMLW